MQKHDHIAKQFRIPLLPGSIDADFIRLRKNRPSMKHLGLIGGFVLALALAGAPALAAIVCPSGKTVLTGVDVSQYAGTVDWPSMKGSGIYFAFARVSDGTNLDNSFDTNYAGIQTAGMVRGAYQFFEPAQDPVAQANLCLSKIGSLSPGDLPPVLDVEKTGGQSPSAIISEIQAWVTAVQQATGRTPIIYTSASFWNGSVSSSAFSMNSLWIADWGVQCPNLPSTWSQWQFWQYSDSGSIKGVGGTFDLDEFNGDLFALQAMTGPPTPNSAPVVLNPIPDQIVTNLFAYTFPANTFNDPDANQTLTYAASNMPMGMTFDGPSRTFQGTNLDLGIYAVTVIATDNGVPPLSTNYSFHFNVVLPNNAPVLVQAIPDQTNAYGAEVNYTFSTNTFSDPDLGQTLSYTTSILPPGITFDGPNRTFQGTNIIYNNYTVTVTATDNGQPPMSANCNFTFRTAPDSTENLNAQALWSWQPVEFPEYADVWSTPVVARIFDSNGDGVVDAHDDPSIIFISGNSTNIDFSKTSQPGLRDGVLRVLNGRTGAEQFSLGGFAGVSVAVGDVLRNGTVQIAAVTSDGAVVLIGSTNAPPVAPLSVLATSPSGAVVHCGNFGCDFDTLGTGGGLAIGDLDGDGSPEIAYGSTVLSLAFGDFAGGWCGSCDYTPKLPSGEGGLEYGYLSTMVSLDGNDLELLAGNTAYKADGSYGTLLWFRTDLPDGFDAVADLDGDGKPDVVLVGNEQLWILDGATGTTKLGPITLPGSGFGGAPVVADFDGDGKPEIGVATATAYSVLKPDFVNQQVNVVWQTATHSSLVGSASTAFDFEGNGHPSVVYADEDFLWVFDGATGAVRFAIPDTSLELGTPSPVVADVDGDGRAEIVMISARAGPDDQGLTVFRSGGIPWAKAPAMWNESTFHVSNVNDGTGTLYPLLPCGAIPQHEIPNWSVPWLNNFRQNLLGPGGHEHQELMVTNQADGGPGSLRQAIADANAGDNIHIRLSETINLTNVLVISQPVNIIGPADASATVSGDGAWRIFEVTAGPTTISRLVLANGTDSNSPLSPGGGAIRATAQLDLEQCTLSNNVANGGGAVGNFGATNVLVVNRCTLAGNTASSAAFGGGAVWNQGVLRVTNSTLAFNSAQAQGGAVLNENDAIVASCTIADNSVMAGNGFGGGIYNGGLTTAGGTLVVQNSIVAGNVAASQREISGTLTSGDYNLIQNPDGLPVPGSHNVLGLDPLLGPLQNNGGPTPTMALASTSPALNAAGEGSPLIDQRGASRFDGKGLDIGAFEAPPPPNHAPIVEQPTPDQTGTYGTLFSLEIPTNTFSDPDTGQLLTISISNLPPDLGFGSANDPMDHAIHGMIHFAGTWQVTVTATDNGVPPLSTNDTFNIVVAKVSLIVTANNTNRPYGVENPPLTGTFSGVTNNDNITTAFATTAVQNSPPGDYSITPVLLDPDGRLANYLVATNLGVLTVEGVTLVSEVSGGSAMFCWPTNAADFVLEYADSLTPPVAWQPVTSGITTNGSTICFTVTHDAAVASRFYRLRLP